MNLSTYLGGLGLMGIVWGLGVLRYWVAVFQQNNTAVAVTLAVVSTLLFFTLLAIIVVLWVQNNRMITQSRQAEFGSGFYSPARPTLYGLTGYRKMFMALEDGLNREEILTLAHNLDVRLEVGEGVDRSKILRELLLHLENRGEMGRLYMLIGADDDYQHIQNVLLE